MSSVGGLPPMSAPSAGADGTEEVELGDASPVVDGGGGAGQPGSDGWSRPTPPSSLPGITPVSSNIPLNSPSHQQVNPTVQAKIESIKAWGISTYKYSRQLISEKLGKSSRTVDVELDAQIERLRETQKEYLNVLKLARALSSHFCNMLNTQLQLSEQFTELGQHSPELQDEFVYNATTQRALHKNGRTLLNALNFFVSSINTLCNKTMDDTLITIKQYEMARIEYDAYRADLEWLQQGGDAAAGAAAKVEEARRLHDAKKAHYEKLRADVVIKLRFLNENRVKVMHKQLVLYHNAVSNYFTGNQRALEGTLKQFHVKTPSAADPSFLEKDSA
ncbi:arfaptin-2-like [Amphibalanus amphitrite]|uniref:arfaptin-2-like n=1 Tax=Amphibalanus amphitrite TaxID=1232801 RepID=UPI001C9272FF|nr:arfaptin-2-like [Amphibalanus amphitrite]XP_043244040.1 arfaptin-2-like [Amphibalanus amphitrite]XP_043244042.1 arfaptin-2-like [Amphibalanus amphitrite]